MHDALQSLRICQYSQFVDCVWERVVEVVGERCGPEGRKRIFAFNHRLVTYIACTNSMLSPLTVIPMCFLVP